MSRKMSNLEERPSRVLSVRWSARLIKLMDTLVKPGTKGFPRPLILKRPEFGRDEA